MLTVRCAVVTTAILQIFSTPLIRLYTAENTQISWIYLGRISERLFHPSRIGYSVPFKVSTLVIFIAADCWLVSDVSGNPRRNDRYIQSEVSRGGYRLSLARVSDSRWLNVLCEMMWCDVMLHRTLYVVPVQHSHILDIQGRYRAAPFHDFYPDYWGQIGNWTPPVSY